MNRIKPLVKKLIGTEDPEELMLEILEVLSQSTTNTPEVGKFYTFVYSPKTNFLRYDSHPLVGVTGVYSWGFTGFNFHWGEPRQYTSGEVIGPLYIVDKSELSDLRRIPFRKIQINN
jgi:hypothetical protein